MVARQSFEGIAVPTAVLVVNGAREGPTLCLTAALHGDELNGIEIVRRVMYDLEPQKLAGTVIGVPIVNLHGFRRSSRYLPDRRDLNRFFPGADNGSSARASRTRSSTRWSETATRWSTSTPDRSSAPTCRSCAPT